MMGVGQNQNYDGTTMPEQDVDDAANIFCQIHNNLRVLVDSK